MKKIVGILSAAAVLATSVFAADVNAATKIAGSLFTLDKQYEKEAGKDKAKTDKMETQLFKENNSSHHYDNPNLVFSISDERAGASIKVSSSGAGNALVLCNQSIWFKPFDFLKVTLGNYDVALNKETIKCTQSVTGLGGEGYLASVNKGKVSFDFGLNEGAGANWLSFSTDNTKEKDKTDTAMKPFFAKASYTDDFGAIGAYAKVNQLGWVDGKNYKFGDKTVEKFLVDALGTRPNLTKTSTELVVATAAPTDDYSFDTDGKDKDTKVEYNKIQNLDEGNVLYKKVTTKRNVVETDTLGFANVKIADMDFGVGYKNTFAKTSDNPITMFVNVAGHVEKVSDLKFSFSTGNLKEQVITASDSNINVGVTNMWIRPELFATGTLGEKIGWSAFAAPKFGRISADKVENFVSGATVDNLNVEVLVKATYKLKKLTPYVQFDGIFDNVKSKIGDADALSTTNLKTESKLGATGSVGLMSWDIAVVVNTDNTKTQKDADKYDVKDSLKVSIPLALSVSF